MPRIALILSTLLALAACETIEGAGRDLSNAGNNITEESRKTQQQM